VQIGECTAIGYLAGTNCKINHKEHEGSPRKLEKNQFVAAGCYPEFLDFSGSGLRATSCPWWLGQILRIDIDDDVGSRDFLCPGEGEHRAYGTVHLFSTLRFQDEVIAVLAL